MKTIAFNKMWASALLGIIVALSGVMSVSAQGLGLVASSKKVEMFSTVELVSTSWHDEEKDELHFEEITIDIEEVPTVTFINKMGEVVAVLKGDKSVLDEIYKDRMSKSYFLSSFGVHEVYLLR